MTVEPSQVVWWRSLYWRIGVGLVLFVIGVTVAQALLFSYKLARASQDLRMSPNAAAMDISFTLAERLERGEPLDLPRLQRERYPDWTQIYVVTRDGRIHAATGVPLDPAVAATARQILDPTAHRGQSIARPAGPVVMAPLRVHRELFGVVVLPPPALTVGARLLHPLSAQNLLLLVAVTVLATVVIFGPAHRRLSALECAAERMRQGDLQARAPAAGGDEIARVARAFNRMGDELAARDESLRQVDTLRRQMLADVSHELKTPLTAMRGFIETLQMSEVAADPERRARYFATISRETTRLERIVSDLLDVAQLEHGVTGFEPRVFDTRRLLEQVARRHEPAATARGVRLRIDVADDADQINGDPHRLEQAVENLVANAMRHAPDGSEVVMHASCVDDGVRLVVRDAGPGIPAEHLAHVFDRFYKADPSRAASGEGSGLGLSIVKAIVERHGGRVGVTSRPGDTQFTIDLPADAPS